MLSQMDSVKEHQGLIHIRVKSVEERWIERSRRNPIDFMTYLTEYTPSNHQIEWLTAIFASDSSRTNIIAFPGSAKTSTLQIALAFTIGKMPWLTNMITCAAEDQAKDRLAAVREIVTLNERYKNVFPWIQLDQKRPNTSTQLNVWSNRLPGAGGEIGYPQYRSYISKYGQSKDHTLFAAGATSKTISGKRITGLSLTDDIHDQENSATEEQRRKVIFIFRTVILTRLFGPMAKQVCINTRWAETDLPGTLAEKKRKNGSKVWKTIVTPIEDENGHPTWPEVWGKKEIEDRADDVGGKESPEWQLSYMNSVVGGASGEFDKNMFLDLPDELPTFKDLFISCDFSKSEGMKSDYSVFTAIARDMNKPFNVYILGMVRFKKKRIVEGKVEELAKFSDKIFEQYGQLDAILFEDKDSQAEYQATIDARPDLPVKIVKIKGDKGTRLNSFATWAQNGRVYVNKRMTHYWAMIGELLSFPKGAHDDICDSLSLPFQLTSWIPKRNKAGIVYIESPYLI